MTNPYIVEFNCIVCGKLDSIPRSQKKLGKGRGSFCDQNCYRKYYKMNPDAYPSFKPKGFIDPAGYHVIRSVRQHRLIMEKHLGRKLGPKEHVHHINGVKHDNRIENLVVLTSSQHFKHHMTKEVLSRGGLNGARTQKKNWKKFIKAYWSVSHRHCVKCRTRKNRHQGLGLCKSCYRKKYKQTKGEL